jgi:uncharacterized membrane protein
MLIVTGNVAFVMRVVRTSSGRGWCTYREPDAMEIARQRWAKGEISKEQFEQLKSDLVGR